MSACVEAGAGRAVDMNDMNKNAVNPVFHEGNEVVLVRAIRVPVASSSG